MTVTESLANLQKEMAEIRSGLFYKGTSAKQSSPVQEGLASSRSLYSRTALATNVRTPVNSRNVLRTNQTAIMGRKVLDGMAVTLPTGSIDGQVCQGCQLGRKWSGIGFL